MMIIGIMEATVNDIKIFIPRLFRFFINTFPLPAQLPL